MKKKISVIIPVYNAMTSGGGYITRCVDSVLAQKDLPIEDLEIILLNDGSTDNSLEILNKLKNKNDNIIKIINQKNMGVAKTRNKGIDIANGEYIMFIDQDDWIDDDYCKTLYKAAVESNVDVVISGVKRPNQDGEIIFFYSPNGSTFEIYILVSGWGKLHKRSFLLDNRIFFKGAVGEDTFFTIKEILQTNKIKPISYVGYNWFLNEHSVSKTVQQGLTPDFCNSLLQPLKSLKDEYERKSIDRDPFLFDYFLLYTVVGYLAVSGRTAKPKDFIDAFNSTFGWLENNTNYKIWDMRKKHSKYK